MKRRINRFHIWLTTYAFIVGMIAGLYGYHLWVPHKSYKTCLSCYQNGVIDTLNEYRDCTDLPFFRDWKDLEKYLDELSKRKNMYKVPQKEVNKNANYYTTARR